MVIPNGNFDYFKKKQQELIEFGNMEGYFDSLPLGQIHKYFMPMYDNCLLVKKEIPNIFHQDNTSKKNHYHTLSICLLLHILYLVHG